ncbi:uncharacterized protein [Diadema setosum]|uniref:uncharacterized protein n=1 Tax=Diadema setosum TaxID=31175 RepID=UPI003B3A3373
MGSITRPFVLPLATALMCLNSYSLAVEVYKFYEGRDVSLKFNQPLSSDSTFEYEIHLIYSSCFFCRNGTMIPGCLTPQQSMRFSVHFLRTSTNLTVTLRIHNINAEDSQIYLFAMREDRNGKRHFSNQDAYIEVLRPPSPPHCIIKPTEYSAALNEINCTCLLGSDGDGSLYCFQDARKIPYKGAPVRLNDHVTWVFWMDALLPVKCCSYEPTFPITSESCSQFVHHPSTHIGNAEDSITPFSGYMTTITGDPERTDEINFSQKVREESNSATTTAHEAFTKSTLIALMILFSLSL